MTNREPKSLNEIKKKGSSEDLNPSVANAGRSTVFQFPLLNQIANYPPVRAFSEDFADSEIIGATSPQVESIAPLHLDVRAPSVEEGTDFEAYIFALRQEMALLRLQTKLITRPVVYLNWVGAAYSRMDAAELTQLMHYISRYFKLNKQTDRVYSIDVDPRYMDPTKIDLLRGLGFNRLNMLVFDFHVNEIANTNGNLFIDSVRSQFEYARQHSFQSVGLTMRCGAPGQSRQSVEENLKMLVELGPDEVCYQCCRGSSGDELLRPHNHTHAYDVFNFLTTNGYTYIGFNNFVSNEALLSKRNTKRVADRNTQDNSVHDIEQVGVGPGALSQFRKVAIKNAKDFGKYQSDLSNNRLPFAKAISLSTFHQIRKCIIEQLITQHRIDVKLLELEFGFHFEQYFENEMAYLNELVNDGLINWDGIKHIFYVETPLLIEELCLLFNEYE